MSIYRTCAGPPRKSPAMILYTNKREEFSVKRGTWSAAFTIVVDGVEVDLMELSQASRTLILLQLRQGITCGELLEEEACEQAAS